MNSVDFSLTNKDIIYEIRTEIKRSGRTIPDLIISTPDVGKSRNYSRNFNSSVYDRFKWLCGCPKRNKLFCFICLVMGGNQSTWTQEGLMSNPTDTPCAHPYNTPMSHHCIYIIEKDERRKNLNLEGQL
ncbi:hypothetical protein NQ318_012081 [Aromia moschata]|uniref:Zinc finger MYM-type protein 1-like n=1 Tax=Aromia moschata TaxID=1265417 RepID=A0AAV8X0P2_9CUCU|nr:hypothetical protein NQ318_012081 [Aromia moschata]